MPDLLVTFDMRNAEDRIQREALLGQEWWCMRMQETDNNAKCEMGKLPRRRTISTGAQDYDD